MLTLDSSVANSASMGVDVSRNNVCRSKSNHRCCYNSRYRNKSTRYASDSCSSSSYSSTSRRKRSISSDNPSSGHSCTTSKRPRFRDSFKRYKNKVYFIQIMFFVLQILLNVIVFIPLLQAKA